MIKSSLSTGDNHECRARGEEPQHGQVRAIGPISAWCGKKREESEAFDAATFRLICLKAANCSSLDQRTAAPTAMTTELLSDD